jgi:hypothetical protein
MKKQFHDSFNSLKEPIKVKIIEETEKIDWNVWFLLIAVLSLVAAVLIPFLQKKYEERKTKYGFHLYVKKKIGIIWNLLTYDKFSYKQPTSAGSMEELMLSFDKIIYQFESDFKRNRNTIHPLFAFGLLFNFQNILFTVKRVQYALKDIDLDNLDEKTLEFGDKLSKKEHHKLAAVFMLIEHYYSITSFHDKFENLKSIKRETKNSKWIGLKIESTVLENQNLIIEDLSYLRENEVSVIEILNINKLLIQEIKSYFDYNKLITKKER